MQGIIYNKKGHPIKERIDERLMKIKGKDMSIGVDHGT